MAAKIKKDGWVCAECGATLAIDSGDRPRLGIRASNSEPKSYFALVGGREIHRCVARTNGLPG